MFVKSVLRESTILYDLNVRIGDVKFVVFGMWYLVFHMFTYKHESAEVSVFPYSLQLDALHITHWNNKSDHIDSRLLMNHGGPFL